MRFREAGRRVAIAALCLVAAPLAGAGTIGLSWDPVTGATGYRVYYGPSEGNYTSSLNVGLATQATVSTPTDCTDWHLAVKAYNSVGESPTYSQEIVGWPRPSMSSMKIDNGPAVQQVVAMQGTQAVLSVTGKNFQPGLSLEVGNRPALKDVNGDGLVNAFDHLIVVDSVSVSSCNQIQAVVSVGPGGAGLLAAEVGVWDVTVVNPPDPSDEQVYQRFPDAFAVSVDPARFDINRSSPSTVDRLDGKDTIWFASVFGLHENTVLFDPDSDFNGDGWTDGDDLTYLANDMGKCWSAANKAWSAAACQQ